MFPRAEVQSAVGNGKHNLTAHYLTFHVGIGVVFARTVVVIALRRSIKRREGLEPEFVVVVQPRLVVVDKDRGSDVHGANQHQALLDPALLYQALHLRVERDDGPSLGHLQPEFLS